MGTDERAREAGVNARNHSFSCIPSLRRAWRRDWLACQAVRHRPALQGYGATSSPLACAPGIGCSQTAGSPSRSPPVRRPDFAPAGSFRLRSASSDRQDVVAAFVLAALGEGLVAGLPSRSSFERRPDFAPCGSYVVAAFAALRLAKGSWLACQAVAYSNVGPTSLPAGATSWQPSPRCAWRRARGWLAKP
jgi:hypothetical protein